MFREQGKTSPLNTSCTPLSTFGDPKTKPSPQIKPDHLRSGQYATMNRNPVNVIKSCSFRGNFIENEIREAAEREEEWKQEKTGSNSALHFAIGFCITRNFLQNQQLFY